jgi:lyso-ornithine lipid O-acyltransferase
VPILNFPEGTTTEGNGCLRFRRGIFGVARLSGVPVTPLGIRLDSPELCWVGGALFLPHYLKTASRPHTRVRIEVGDAIDPGRYAHADALAREARARVSELIAGNEPLSARRPS